VNITNKTPAPPSPPVFPDAPVDAGNDEFRLPVETEIYILPDGRVIVADLPAELAELPVALGDLIS
jgi:hypothetical protein